MPNENETRLETILRLKAEGLKPKQIANEVGTEEEPLTYQEVVKLVKEAETKKSEESDEDDADFEEVPKPTTKKTKAVAKPAVEVDEVIPVKVMLTQSAEEYAEYSVANGRTRQGGERGVKVDATIEMLRAYINSNWKPSMLLEMWQMSEEELKQLTWKLAKAELRDRQPTVNYKQDFFRF